MKRIIDIPDNIYSEYKYQVDHRIDYNPAKMYIANSIPYEEKPKYFPPCEDCNKKMEEIRQAYDKMKAMERPQGECCGSCYLCDVGDCGAKMKGGAEE